MMQLRSLQRQLESKARKEHLFKQAAKPLAERKIVYPEILELCRELKWQVQELTGLERAKILDKTVEKIVYLDSNFLNIVAVLVLPSPPSPESNVVVY